MAAPLFSQEVSQGESSSSKRPLSPEERQQKKQERMKREMEAEQARVATFGAIPDSDLSPPAANYRKAVEEFRKATAEFSDIQARLQYRFDVNVGDVERYRWLERLENNFQKLLALRLAASELIESDPALYENVALMLREMLITEVAADRSDHWARPARAVLACGKLVDEDVLLNAGYAGLADSDWELTISTWSRLQEQGRLPEVEQIILRQIPEMRANWEKELELRKEDQRKNNPRVEFLTSKGIIEIELFEDEAPETVASFIYLIENGYYNRKPFFLVRRHFLAQTGCEKGDGKGTAGYTIRFEGDAPNHRRHFRGSVAIPLGIDTETQNVNTESGGAQFYISYFPIPILDGKHTVFGRIVKGIEIIGLLKEVNLTDEEQRKDQHLHPDRVIVAKVLNKRSHEYRPTPVLGRLPR
jgi:cyclophilin family peptidyl-prolyl cis-trans isomerase